jgi:hypothetical protein
MVLPALETGTPSVATGTRGREGSWPSSGVAGTMRRQSTWTPAIVSNRADRTDREINVGEPSGVVQGPAVSALIAENIDTDGSFGDRCKAPDQELQRRADIRFAIGIALTLTLPALISMGAYIATVALLKAS